MDVDGNADGIGRGTGMTVRPYLYTCFPLVLPSRLGNLFETGDRRVSFDTLRLIRARTRPESRRATPAGATTDTRRLNNGAHIRRAIPPPPPTRLDHPRKERRKGEEKKIPLLLVLSPTRAFSPPFSFSRASKLGKGPIPSLFPPHPPFFSRAARLNRNQVPPVSRVPRQPTGFFDSTYHRNYYYACEKVDIERNARYLIFFGLVLIVITVFPSCSHLIPTLRVY